MWFNCSFRLLGCTEGRGGEMPHVFHFEKQYFYIGKNSLFLIEQTGLCTQWNCQRSCCIQSWVEGVWVTGGRILDVSHLHWKSPDASCFCSATRRTFLQRGSMGMRYPQQFALSCAEVHPQLKLEPCFLGQWTYYVAPNATSQFLCQSLRAGALLLLWDQVA